jgi:hypothetical protein
MVTMEWTIEETRAIADLIRGNSVETRWLCSVFNKITAAIDNDDQGKAT